MSSTLVAPIATRRVTSCGVCDSQNLETVLSLGSSPPPCAMHPVGERPLVEEHYPLELLRCSDCTLTQLSVIVDPKVVFAPDFPYSSGNSRQLHENFDGLTRAWRHRVGGVHPEDLVVDIGANDGTLLSKLRGCRKVAVEPTEQVRRAEGCYQYEACFTEQLACEIVDRHGQAKLITACNVMAHVEDVHDVMRGIEVLLADDGLLIVENHDVRSVLAGQWDMVYHEHLRFYSPHSFARLLEEHGLGCVEWHSTSTHGGSFRMYADKQPAWVPAPVAEDFAQLRISARVARGHIRHAVSQGPVVGIGATARGTTILNCCGLDVDDVECVVEVPGSDKIGRYVPGTSIPVVDEARLFEPDAPTGLLLSWHMADIIVLKLRAKGYDRPIIVPLPRLHYV